MKTCGKTMETFWDQVSKHMVPHREKNAMIQELSEWQK